MDRRAFLASAATGVLAACLSPTDAVAPSLLARATVAHPLLGLNAPTYHWREAETRGHLGALGVQYVRITAVLQAWETVPSYGAYLRESAALAEADGVEILWVLHNADGYFRAAPGEGWEERMARFAAHVAAIPGTAAIQLWNEPDVWHQAPFGAGQDRPARECGRRYARHVAAVAAQVRAQSPGVRIVTAGTADHPSERWRGFLAGMMESPPPCDAIGFHSYGPWERTRGRILEARSILGDHAPLWVTECGNDRPDDFDPAHQLRCWQGVVEGNERERLAERVYPYSLVTDPADPGHGLLNLDGSPRPAYTWLERRAWT